LPGKKERERGKKDGLKGGGGGKKVEAKGQVHFVAGNGKGEKKRRGGVVFLSSRGGEGEGKEERTRGTLLRKERGGGPIASSLFRARGVHENEEEDGTT